MSTKMDEDDWAHTLAVFRACLPRRGRKAEDDRRFLEALHFFTVENVRWRARRSASVLGTACGSASIGQARAAFRGVLRRARVHEFHGASPSDVQLHRRACACFGGWSKGGQEGQALGRSRGGFTTKIHPKSDASGDIIAFDLIRGKAFDRRHFETLLDIGLNIQPHAVICDKGPPARLIGTPRERAASLPSSPTRPTKRTSQHSSHAPSKRPAPGSSRASDGSSASSGSRSDGKDRTKLQIHPLLRRRPMLDQIRPHGLVSASSRIT